MFNLRLRLDAVRMKPEDRKQVEAELKSVRTEMLDKLEEVNRRRNEIIAGKTAPAREAMQQRIAEYAAGLPGCAVSCMESCRTTLPKTIRICSRGRRLSAKCWL